MRFNLDYINFLTQFFPMFYVVSRFTVATLLRAFYIWANYKYLRRELYIRWRASVFVGVDLFKISSKIARFS